MSRQLDGRGMYTFMTWSDYYRNTSFFYNIEMKSSWIPCKIGTWLEQGYNIICILGMETNLRWGRVMIGYWGRVLIGCWGRFMIGCWGRVMIGCWGRFMIGCWGKVMIGRNYQPGICVDKQCLCWNRCKSMVIFSNVSNFQLLGGCIISKSDAMLKCSVC